MTLDFFAYFYHSGIWPVVNISEKILDPSEVKFMNLAPSVLDVDHVAKIISGRSITVLEKKIHKIMAQKVTLADLSDFRWNWHWSH